MAGEQPTRLSEIIPGSRLRSYELLEYIGAGGQGVVWSGLERAHSRVVAIKFDEVAGASLEEEDRVMLPQADILLRLRHAHVLPLYDLGASGQLQYIVSPYLSGGSLADWLREGSLTTEDALRLAAEIASGLDYLHAQGIIHRDLKPGNVLLGFARHAYITDFGLARVLSSTTRAMHTGRGTPLYAPPEQHAMARITLQSDIFSLGIMLYELFSGQLPWAAQKALGVEQLHSRAVIPDPREINPSLPEGLAGILRQMTAAEPGARPASAGEAVRAIYAHFGIRYPSTAADDEKTALWLRNADADDLLNRNLSEWRQSGEATHLSLTRFALLELHQRQVGPTALPEDVRQFMLQQAITFGHEHMFWWKQVTEARTKLDLAATIIRQNNAPATFRVVRHLLDDPALAGSAPSSRAGLTEALLGVAWNAADARLRGESLKALLHLLPPAREWQEVAIGPERDADLAGLALEDPPQGARAARLIGHLRSLTALRKLIEIAPRSRRDVVLQQVWKAAGGLPAMVPADIRLGIFFRWLGGRLAARPLRSLFAFALAAIGGTLGFGMVTYLFYRLPDYFDATRWRISFERGWFMGVTFGFSLLLTRLIAERLSRLKPLWRCLLATVTGGLALVASTAAYQATILNTPAHGGLILAGSLLIALGFAVGAFTRSRLWKIAVSLLTSFVAIVGTWGLHVSLATLSTELSPILRFEYGLPWLQVLSLTSIVVLPMAILANLIDLDLPED